jgi:two-component system cell cycle sensor histidine kinase/response regulator CckA
MLAVSDNGCGMDEAVKARIFEPFFTTKEKGKGTGLGLATVYGIVKQSKGSIWCYSEKGKGTTFKVYLPVVLEEAPVVRVKKAITQEVTGTETILIAEDDDAIRAIMCEALKLSGYNVISAGNGKEALIAGVNWKDIIHLLITDVIMPDMSGSKLAENLKEARPGLKILFSSGYTDDTIVNHGVLNEGTPFLQKPYSIETLFSKVREALDA